MNQIGFIIVKLRPLDNLILSQVKHAFNSHLTSHLVGRGLCVLGMLEIFPGGREPEVDRDGSRVVVAVRKRRKEKRLI